MRPAQLYLEAFYAASTRRRILQELNEKDGGSGSFVGLSNKEESVKPGRYLGQLEINSNSNPGDEQVETWLQMEELENLENTNGDKGESTFSFVYLLKAAKNAAIEASKSSVLPFTKLQASIDTLLGEELLYYSGDCTAAKEVLSTAAEQYRKDRWSGPLYRVLMALRECASGENNIAEHVTLSLEAATAIAASNRDASSTGVDSNVVDMAQAAVEDLPSTELNYSAEFISETETAPWAKIVKISAAGFKKSSGAGKDIDQGGIFDIFEVKLQNDAPVDIPFLSASVLLEDSHGTFEMKLGTKLGAALASSTIDTISTTKTITENVLPGTRSSRSNKEKTTSVGLVCTLPSGRKSSPWIAASKLKLVLSTNFSITYLLPAAMTLLPIPMGETAVKGPPSLRIDLPARHPAPSVALLVPEKGFTGEYLPAKVRIMTKTAQDKGKSTAGGVVAFKKCRLLVSAHVAEKAAAVLFTKSNNSGKQLQDQLEFDVEDPTLTQKNFVEIEFGFSAQAPVEETLNFSAQLHYTIEYPLEAEEEETEEEQGVVDVNAAVAVLLPFECDVLITPMAVPPPRMANHSISGSTGSSPSIAGPVYTLDSSSIRSLSTNTSSAGVVEDVLSANLRSLSVQDAQLRQNIAPRLPPHFTLPVGAENSAQWYAAVSVRKVKPRGGEWRNDASLEPLSIIKLFIENSVGSGSFLNISPLENEEEVSEVDITVLAELNTPGDTCCAAFQITTQQRNESDSADGCIPSLGDLVITWQRSSPIHLIPHYDASSSSFSIPNSSNSSSSTEDRVVHTSTLEGLNDGKLVIPLPPVLCSSPLITAQPFYPPSATAGEAITLEIEIRFQGKEALDSQEVEVVVGEPHGFLIAGPRATTLRPLGGGGGADGGSDSSRISLCLVPYHVGFLELPEVKVSVYGQKELQATQGCTVFVVGRTAVASE